MVANLNVLQNREGNKSFLWHKHTTRSTDIYTDTLCLAVIMKSKLFPLLFVTLYLTIQRARRDEHGHEVFFPLNFFFFFGGWGGGGGANWCPRWIHRFTGLKFSCITRFDLRYVERNYRLSDVIRNDYLTR